MSSQRRPQQQTSRRALLFDKLKSRSAAPLNPAPFEELGSFVLLSYE